MSIVKPYTLISIFLILISELSFASEVDSIKALLYDAHNAERKIELYTQLSREYLSIDLVEAHNHIQQAITLSEGTNTNTYKGDIYALLGDIAVRQDSLELANTYYKEALAFFNESNQASRLIGINNVLGNIALTFDDFSSAMGFYLKAIDYATVINDIEMLSSIYLNIGTIHHYSDRVKESQEYFLKALSGFLETGDTTLAAEAYVNLGYTYLMRGDFQLAKKYMNLAINVFEDKDLTTRLSIAYQGLSQIYQQESDYENAIANLKIAAEYLEKESPGYSGPKQPQWASYYIGLGKNYFLSGNTSMAYTPLLQAFRISKASGNLITTEGAAYYLSQFWEVKGNIDSAYYYHKIFHAYADSLKDKDNIRGLALQEADFKHSHELLAEKQERELQENINSRNLVIFIITIISLLLVLLVLILFLKLNRNKTKQALIEQKSLENELQLRNRELSSQLTNQVQNNEFILNISKKIKKLYSDVKPENKKVLHDIIRELESDFSNQQWDEFESRFQQVNNSFYKNLGEKYPDLTTNEIRLCTFLKLNMNTKDIAAITYQTNNSLTVARWRLRQKFGLKKEETLSSFLTQF